MTRTMKKVVGFVLMVCMIVSLFAGVTSAFAAKAFKDVPDGHWAKPYVDFVVDKGYFAGVSEDKFDPDGKMTRAMFVAVIGKVEGLTFDNSVASGYSDVPSGKYYTGAVKWATDGKIVSGIGNNQYGPNLPITREQICVMMDKYIQYHDANNKEKYLDRDSSVEFKDASDISTWAKESVQKCVSYGLIQGYPDGKFKPKNHATRAEVAVMIYRLALYIEEETKPTEFKAVYKFVSGTEGKKLDSKVEALLPSDANKYKDGDAVKAVDPKETTVMADDGVWTFAGYDKKEAKVDKADVVFTGKWTFAAVDTKEYTVEYKFVSGTKGVELPALLTTTLLPKDTNSYLSGETVKAVDPASKQYTTLQGRWDFVGYDKTEVKVEHANVVFTGTWERSPLVPETFAVQYVFKTDDGKDVPAAVNNVKPVSTARVQNGAEVEAQAPRETSVIDGNDTWQFVSYDKQKATVNGADVVFTGTWKKTTTKKYKVTYKNQINASIDVPAAVQKELDSRLPKVKEYDNGSTVALETPLQGTYATKEGTWRFIAFADLGQNLTRSVVIRDQDVEVTWVWSLLLPSRTYKVNYTYDLNGVALADRRAVQATLPNDPASYYEGDEAAILQPSSVKVPNSNRTAEYVFQGYNGYDEDDKTIEIENSNVTLTGTWKLCEYRTVEYKYVTSDGSEFAADVKDKITKTLLPTDSNKYVEGDKVTVKDPAETVVKSAKTGVRYFYEGIDEAKSGVTIKDGAFAVPEGTGKIVLQGVWKPSKDYSVFYKFVDADGKAITDKKLLALAKTETGKKDGDRVTAQTQPATFPSDGCIWTFDGYDKDYDTIKGNDVTFTATWKQEKTYKATYSFKSSNPKNTLISSIVGLLDTKYVEKKGLRNGEKVVAEIPEDIKVDNGVWHFKEWKPSKEQTVNGKDIAFEGIWEFKETTT